MRLPLLCALLALPLLPTSQAFADTFTFTPNGGTAITFVTGTPYSYNTTPPVNVVTYSPTSNSNVSTVNFYGATEAPFFFAAGYGQFDIQIFVNGTEYLEDGPQLFTGLLASNNPTFIDGSYTLTGDRGEGAGVGGTLTISPNPTAAVTPEPSSFALLGTGLLGFAGMVRRRMTARHAA